MFSNFLNQLKSFLDSEEAQKITKEENFNEYLKFILSTTEELIEKNFDIDPSLKAIANTLKVEGTGAILHQFFIERIYPNLKAKLNDKIELVVLHEKLPVILAEDELPLVMRLIELKLQAKKLSRQDLESIEEHFKDKAGRPFQVWLHEQREKLPSISQEESVAIAYRP